MVIIIIIIIMIMMMMIIIIIIIIVLVITTTTTTAIISFWLFQIRVWNSDAFNDSSHNHARGIYFSLAQDVELNLPSNIFLKVRLRFFSLEFFLFSFSFSRNGLLFL